MKRSIVISALTVFGLSALAAAQTPAMPSAPAPAGSTAASTAVAPAGPTRIGVIAFQVAVGQTNEFQRAFTDLQKKYDPKKQQLKALNDEVDNLTKQLQTQGATLSDEERATRTRTLDDKKKQLDRQAQDAQNDFQTELQDLYAGTASKVFDVLSNYAQQNGYTLILDVATQQTPVMYALPSTDITKAVVEAYNVKSGVPAPPAGTPSAPAPKTGSAKPPTRQGP